MSNDATRLRELLAYHGSDVSRWPGDAAALGKKALERPELAAIVEQEKRFEQLLLARRVPAAPHDLSRRIIAAALARPLAQASASWFRELLAEVRPAALAATLVLGFAIGFGIVTASSQPHTSSLAQSAVDDEGAIL